MQFLNGLRKRADGLRLGGDDFGKSLRLCLIARLAIGAQQGFANVASQSHALGFGRVIDPRM